MRVLNRNGRNVALLDTAAKIAAAQDLLDLMATAVYAHDCCGLIVYKESLPDGFFDLKTRIAGEFLQKCSNYQMKFAVVGDFSAYTSKSLRDFIYECNKGRLVFFKPDVDSALESMTAV
jgi:hypothetical protein